MNSLKARILSAIGLGIVWVTGPWFLVLIWAVVHMIYFRGLEVIFLALLVDVFYTNTQAVPYYTLAVMAGLLLGEWVQGSVFKDCLISHKSPKWPKV